MMRLAMRLLGLSVLGAACAAGEAAEPHARASADTAVSVAAPVPDSALQYRQPGVLATVAATMVVGRVGPGGAPFEVALRTTILPAPHARRFGTRTLEVQLRTRQPDLTQYPCTSCHAGARLVLRDERSADAHVALRVVHPRETGATCATCHAADNVEQLALRNGERASLDHAYRACAQCHAPQTDAWAAGGHGKRLDGWQGRRVVMNCADCHDPHAPALAPRTPFRAPRLQRTENRMP